MLIQSYLQIHAGRLLCCFGLWLIRCGKPVMRSSPQPNFQLANPVNLPIELQVRAPVEEVRLVPLHLSEIQFLSPWYQTTSSTQNLDYPLVEFSLLRDRLLQLNQSLNAPFLENPNVKWPSYLTQNIASRRWLKIFYSCAIPSRSIHCVFQAILKCQKNLSGRQAVCTAPPYTTGFP